MPYFNYTINAISAATASWWERRAFLGAWWSLYGDDARWTPPPYGRLRRALNPRHNEHLARLEATLIHVEALHRTGVRRSRTDQQEIPLVSVIERPLAAAIALIDPRRKGTTAHLALSHLSADKEAFDTLYYYLVESLSERGYHRLVAPVGLSPHLDSGLLTGAWDAWPPQHTPTNPPYLPELLESRFRPLQHGRLYRADTTQPPGDAPGPAALRPLEPARLAGDLLPLLVAATDNPTAAFPPPDAVEAALLLRLLGPGVFGWLAEVDGEPVGFVLLGPDEAARLRATRGERSLWRRAAYGVAPTLFGRGETAGRLHFGAVHPAWRRQGIGRQLWQRALRAAAGGGWASLVAGPLWLPPSGQSVAAAFLDGRAAVAPQTFQLYERSF